MAKPIYVLNGPNLNMLGLREPAVYGRDSLADVEARDKAQGIIINAGAYSHTSIAILDALQAAEVPAIEVHISNIFRREPYRNHSYVSQAAKGVICGLGAKGYELALEAMAEMLASARRG